MRIETLKQKYEIHKSIGVIFVLRYVCGFPGFPHLQLTSRMSEIGSGFGEGLYKTHQTKVWTTVQQYLFERKYLA